MISCILSEQLHFQRRDLVSIFSNQQKILYIKKISITYNDTLMRYLEKTVLPIGKHSK